MSSKTGKLLLFQDSLISKLRFLEVVDGGFLQTLKILEIQVVQNTAPKMTAGFVTCIAILSYSGMSLSARKKFKNLPYRKENL